MDVRQAELLKRIQDFQFDPPGSTYTFADRLAKENGWTASFTHRAIGEYRRFAYLAAVAGHAVSPSEVVDQVWHLHLLYTRSYWDDFCGRVLRRPLHHEPSVGGGKEREKFAGWYARTLFSYRQHFGEEPPADVWPSPAARQSTRDDVRRVDVSRHWVLPKARLSGAVAASVFAILLLILAAGCGGSRTKAPPSEWTRTINPLDFTGPQFLIFYGMTFAAACWLGCIIRSGAREPTDASRRPLKLDAYAAAYLNGGPVLTANAAMTKLIDRGLLKANADATLKARGGVILNGLHPLESAIYNACGTTLATRVRDVRKAAKRELDRVAGPLRDLGLIPDEGRANTGLLLPTLVALSVPAVGMVKIVVGLDRDRPVGLLVFACFASAMIGVIAFARPIRRTRRGDLALDHLQVTHADLRGRPAALQGDSLALGVGLFGMSLLASTPHADLEKTLQPPRGAGDGGSGGGGCGGGCGGGGGGGGGGGCGGGGCGGCGG